jgi:molybdopterin molybdotransferase
MRRNPIQHTELFTVIPPAQAFAELASRLAALEGVEDVVVESALGRVTAAPVVAGESLPAFPRSTMDGYAVRAADTFGASDAAPAYLRMTGEVRMGTVARETVLRESAIRVHTGAMLPPGADAVVIVEDTNLRGDELEVLRAVAPGDSVVALGEDVREGDTVFAAGHRLRPQDLGALHALGITRVKARRKPVVAVLSSGDEVVAPGVTPPLGAVRDVNGITVAATIERAGGIAIAHGIVPDDEDFLEKNARSALAGADMLVLSAGSSVSAHDITARAVARLGSPGILVHGIAFKPGKPTILALCDGKPVIGLPGNPMSALVVAWRMVRPLIGVLLGVAVPSDGLGEETALEARLTASVSSRPGREDYVPATLRRGADGVMEATPVFGKSTLIFALVRSDGLIEIPLDRAGLAAGSMVRVVIP